MEVKDKPNPKGRAQKRREKLVEKDDDRKFDNKNDRGYTTDQLISFKKNRNHNEKDISGGKKSFNRTKGNRYSRFEYRRQHVVSANFTS